MNFSRLNVNYCESEKFLETTILVRGVLSWASGSSCEDILLLLAEEQKVTIVKSINIAQTKSYTLGKIMLQPNSDAYPKLVKGMPPYSCPPQTSYIS